MNTTIVTAFFDIGRGNWAHKRNLPPYLPRSTDVYFERFSHMAKLENQMIIYTTADMVDRVMACRNKKGRNTTIVTVDFYNQYSNELEKIREIQNNTLYKTKINPLVMTSPEYWSPEYVLVNMLKSVFVNDAIGKGLVSNDLIAWVDFGFCRTKEQAGINVDFMSSFDPNKIHVFSIREYDNKPIIDIIANNVVYLIGSAILAGVDRWRNLKELVLESADYLAKELLVDDDQTLLLLSYLRCPELFELHTIKESDWFVLFTEFNK